MLLVCAVLMSGMTMMVGCGGDSKPAPAKDKDKDKMDKKEKDK
jgi:hypothetical protein